jgi:hypothetical protein
MFFSRMVKLKAPKEVVVVWVGHSPWIVNDWLYEIILTHPREQLLLGHMLIFCFGLNKDKIQKAN